MALRLVKNFRKATFLQGRTRARPAASEEIEEPPHGYYIVKDYDKNPYYMALIHATKPGYKKNYDPYKKATERRDAAWEPRYKHQQVDMGVGWLQLVFFIVLPIEFLVVLLWEGRTIRWRKDPLSFNLGKPSEF